MEIEKYLCNEIMHKSTDATILTNRSALTNEEKVQIAQIFVDASTRDIS